MISHKLRLRYKSTDDKDNAYYTETPIPSIGKAMTVFVREVTTIDEDFHYFFGYAFIGLFTELSETPGIKKERIISHVITDHEPVTSDEFSALSSMVYVRQDPFKETIYILRYSVLFMLA